MENAKRLHSNHFSIGAITEQHLWESGTGILYLHEAPIPFIQQARILILAETIIDSAD
jgi:hypothetical protein